jgi:hypothetical protein
VHELPDGRPFITDMTVRQEPQLVEILRLDEPSNYWQRHEYLQGWVGAKDDEHG